ncbi:MAG: hypothetical protein HN348_25075 [Proteobacteria bacterium]|nr:hypothetical protein [Pseudomonadota bacterium]
MRTIELTNPHRKEHFEFFRQMNHPSAPTSVQHAMSYHPHDSVPRISWGKFVKEGSRTRMPLAVQVHYALVDGRHVGRFFQQFDEAVASFVHSHP